MTERGSVVLRPADERGRSRFGGWLESRHTFSFGSYFDPRHMGFGPLRVINDDRVAPGGGFPPHPHRDMEILSYVVHGAMAHRDSTGESGVIRPGDIQRMTAGTGVVHSEYNDSERDPLRFLQIWIHPERAGLAPSYEHRHYAPRDRRGTLRLVVSRDARDGSLTARQDVDVFATLLASGEEVRHDLGDDRSAWIQIVRGEVALGARHVLAEGDGAAISGGGIIGLRATSESELLLFDLPRVP